MRYLCMLLCACSSPTGRVILQAQLETAQPVADHTVTFDHVELVLQAFSAERGDNRLFTGVEHTVTLTAEAPQVTVTEWSNIPANPQGTQKVEPYAQWALTRFTLSSWSVSGAVDGQPFAFSGGGMECTGPGFTVQDGEEPIIRVLARPHFLFQPENANPDVTWVLQGEMRSAWVANNALRLLQPADPAASIKCALR